MGIVEFIKLSIKAGLLFANNLVLSATTTGVTQAATDNSTKISTTAFVATAVANAVAGVNPAVAVLAATTVAGDTSGLTYVNGVAGVGATLTGAINTAITIDGVAFTAVGQRLLVKNDTQSPSGAFNGVYQMSVLQTVALAPVFVRASDYNQPSDINNTGAIPVVSGTANALTSWLLTSAVTTIGTNALTYSKFSINPSAVVDLTTVQTLTNKRVTPRILSTASYTTDTGTSLNCDNLDEFIVTAQAGAMNFNNPTGTPTDGQVLLIAVTGTAARALTYDTQFQASTVALPTTTVTTARLNMAFLWSAASSTWIILGAS